MNEYPALIISDNLPQIYQNLQNNGLILNIITNVAELRDFLDKYRGVISSSPIVLSDISVLKRHQSRLLKFVEENPNDVICLASEDNISRVLLSRFRQIRKVPSLMEHEMDDPRLLQNKLKGEDGSSVTIEDIIRYGPSIHHGLQMLKRSRLPVKQKIQQILFS